MNLHEKSSTSLDLQHRDKARGISAKGILRFAVLSVIVGFILCNPAASPVLAKSAHQADAAAPAIDPAAMEALKKMGAYLRSLKSFEVEGDVTNDDVLQDGQIVQNASKVKLLAAKPNRLRAEVISDEKQRLFLYDGKNFTVFGRLVNYYATVPAPPTIPELFSAIDEKYGIALPLIDLFKWGTDESDINEITSATDIGPTTIEGVTCEQYAFRQEGIDWQIWIQLGDYPLPLKFVIRTLSDEARPQHSDTLTWNLAPSFNDEAFVFDPPPDAQRILLAEQKPDANQ
jgi:hypothetical protein